MIHIYISKLTNIRSDNGLSPGRRPAIFESFEQIFSEIVGEINTFSLNKRSSAK